MTALEKRSRAIVVLVCSLVDAAANATAAAKVESTQLNDVVFFAKSRDEIWVDLKAEVAAFRILQEG